MPKIAAYGNNHSFTSLGPLTIERRDVGAEDVQIDILYCGVCHSDIHQARNEWLNTNYPCVPGHEIVGRVSAVGSSVTKFAVGEIVAVGCMVDSCLHCDPCKAGEEQYCEGPHGCTMTYNGPMKPDKTNTFGGYSQMVVVKEHFVLKVPANLPVSAVAPILCAGITTYSPLRHWNVKEGDHVAVIGFGGLGHMATKLATAMGASVTVISRTPEKGADALRFGAKKFVLSSDKDAMKELELKFDFILSTIPSAHNINPYVPLLKKDATLAIVGCLTPFALPTDNSQVAFHRRNIAGSLIGGISETQEVLDFCGKHNLLPEVELIPIELINDAFKRVNESDVRYRFVIDIGGSLKGSK
jgi:alcohol dehydrogenase (NADP+)